MRTTKPIKTLKLDMKKGRINLTHGSGGRAMAQLIDQLFAKHFDNPILSQQNDAAVFQVEKGRIAVSTDAHVISPLFFPGGDIGSLSVHGTVNDVAMMGAKPRYLTSSFILEDGFPLSDLEKIVISMSEAAQEAGVSIIAGDTKVVEKNSGDGVFITTTGIGMVPDHIHIDASNAKHGDRVLINGFIGDHGIAVMSQRENLRFKTKIISDTASLNGLIASMLEAVPEIRCLRDPTRGGLATVLNEWAGQSQVGFVIEESQIPLRTEVASACELLGLDPLYVANEGKVVAIVPPEKAEILLSAMRKHPLGKDAMMIGEVVEDPNQFVKLKTLFGGTRLVDLLTGEQLPRIC